MVLGFLMEYQVAIGTIGFPRISWEMTGLVYICVGAYGLIGFCSKLSDVHECAWNNCFWDSPENLWFPLGILHIIGFPSDT